VTTIRRIETTISPDDQRRTSTTFKKILAQFVNGELFFSVAVKHPTSGCLGLHSSSHDVHRPKLESSSRFGNYGGLLAKTCEFLFETVYGFSLVRVPLKQLDGHSDRLSRQ
jgi:hypothetical protein